MMEKSSKIEIQKKLEELSTCLKIFRNNFETFCKDLNEKVNHALVNENDIPNDVIKQVDDGIHLCKQFSNQIITQGEKTITTDDQLKLVQRQPNEDSEIDGAANYDSNTYVKSIITTPGDSRDFGFYSNYDLEQDDSQTYVKNRGGQTVNDCVLSKGRDKEGREGRERADLEHDGSETRYNIPEGQAFNRLNSGFEEDSWNRGYIPEKNNIGKKNVFEDSDWYASSSLNEENPSVITRTSESSSFNITADLSGCISQDTDPKRLKRSAWDIKLPFGKIDNHYPANVEFHGYVRGPAKVKSETSMLYFDQVRPLGDWTCLDNGYITVPEKGAYTFHLVVKASYPKTKNDIENSSCVIRVSRECKYVSPSHWSVCEVQHRDWSNPPNGKVKATNTVDLVRGERIYLECFSTYGTWDLVPNSVNLYILTS